MPRRHVLVDEQLAEFLVLPAATEPMLIQHWMLSPADLVAVERRRGDPNQLGSWPLRLAATNLRPAIAA